MVGAKIERLQAETLRRGMGDRLRLIRLYVVARGEVRQGRGTTIQQMSSSVSQGAEAGSCVGVLGLWGVMQGHRQIRNTRRMSTWCISAGTENSVMP